MPDVVLYCARSDDACGLLQGAAACCTDFPEMVTICDIVGAATSPLDQQVIDSFSVCEVPVFVFLDAVNTGEDRSTEDLDQELLQLAECFYSQYSGRAALVLIDCSGRQDRGASIVDALGEIDRTYALARVQTNEKGHPRLDIREEIAREVRGYFIGYRGDFRGALTRFYLLSRDDTTAESASDQS